MPQRLSDVPLADLVPETRDWNSGNGVDLESWISCTGSFEQAIGYGELFWPDFIELDDCVFFAGATEENYRGFLQQTAGDKRAVEAVMNHCHITGLFVGQERQPSRQHVVYFGRLLCEIWAAKLAREFPHRRFVVSFPEEEYEDLGDYEVSFFQERA